MVNQNVLENRERSLQQKRRRFKSKKKGEIPEDEFHVVRVKGAGGRHPHLVFSSWSSSYGLRIS